MALSIKTAVAAVIGDLGPGPIGVGCSGGADSLALADAAIEMAGAARIVIVTIDHGLTAGSGEVADRVAAWARARGAASVVHAVEVDRGRASLEAAARDARYAGFAEVAREYQLVALLLGHTARDQAETVLMRILRGTGPAGLAAIPARRGIYHRPLLAVDRAEVDAYVTARRLPVWDDPMNADRALARVRVRTELLPLLRTENPQLDAALVRLADSTAEWLEVIDAAAAPLASLPIDCAGLAAAPAAIRKRAIVLAFAGLDAVHVDAIDRLITAPSRGTVSLDVPGGRVVRAYDLLDREHANVATEPPVVPPGYAVRVWQAGDRMQPARLAGHSRKLSDLFADAKVARALRITARVVVREADGTIVWAEHLGIAHESALLDGEWQFVALNPTQSDGGF
ncbi:MAG: tRNA lysidine(34) synthetase TilS [Kofleriaceae bacterium]